MKFALYILFLMIAIVTIIGLNVVNAEKELIAGKINDSEENATKDYYNNYYINRLIPSNQNNQSISNQTNLSGISEWKIDVSNNGWIIAQSWIKKENNMSNVFVTFSDNGGRSYSAPDIVCPGGTDKRSGIFGPEFWILCTRNIEGVDNVFIKETRTGATPLSALTNISIDRLVNSTIVDFAVNGITGNVVATWQEGGTTHMGGSGSVSTYCYRC